MQPNCGLRIADCEPFRYSAFRIPHFAFRGSALALFSCVMAVIFLVGADRAGANEVLAGAAREAFVLPEHVPLAGYSRRKGKPSTGIHDTVGVRALVMEADGVTAALVSCEVLIIDEILAQAVRRRLLERGLPKDIELLLAATHTHSGPGAYGGRFLEKLSMGHFDPAVFEALTETMTRTILQAYADRRPVRYVYRTARTEHLVVNRMDPRGLSDDELTVSAFYAAETPYPVAVVVGFSAHPTTLGAWNTAMSGDYPGVLMRAIERHWPQTHCLFVAAAVGDQAPRNMGEGYERSEWFGDQLAQHVLALLLAPQPEPPLTMRVHREALRLPGARVRVGSRLTLPHWVSRLFVDDDATLSLVRLGRLVYVGVPCDLEAAMGHQIKHAVRARGWEPIIVGFANDYIGYCVSEATYRTGRYEALMAFNGPLAGQVVVERLIQMLDALATSDQQPATRGPLELDGSRPDSP